MLELEDTATGWCKKGYDEILLRSQFNQTTWYCKVANLLAAIPLQS